MNTTNAPANAAQGQLVDPYSRPFAVPEPTAQPTAEPTRAPRLAFWRRRPTPAPVPPAPAPVTTAPVSPAPVSPAPEPTPTRPPFWRRPPPPPPTPPPTPTPTPAPAPTPRPPPAPIPTRMPAPAAMTPFRAGDPGLRTSGSKVAPLVFKDGRPAYEVTFKKGTRGGGNGSNMNAMLAPAAFFPSEQCRFKFRIFFDPNFPWSPQAVKKSAGKILGFFVGSGDASGGNYSTTGASFRVCWSWNGGLAPYLYPQVRREHSKNDSGRNITWTELDQSPQVQSVSAIAMGVHVFYPPRDRQDPSSWDLRLAAGRWNDVEMFMKLNTPGAKDGVLEVTVNGVTRRLDTVRFRYDNSKIMGVKVHPFFGGSTMDYAPPRDCQAWYADFAFGTS